MSEWLTWQVVDSALPTGLFAHSWGLESAWQHGEVHSLEALRAFVDASVLQSGHAVLPLVNAAFRSPERLEALDAVAEAFLTNAGGEPGEPHTGENADRDGRTGLAFRGARDAEGARRRERTRSRRRSIWRAGS